MDEHRWTNEKVEITLFDTNSDLPLYSAENSHQAAVPASTCGPFAVHESVGPGRTDLPYTLTHIQSGFRVARFAHSHLAKSAAEEILDTIPVEELAFDAEAIRTAFTFELREALRKILLRHGAGATEEATA